MVSAKKICWNLAMHVALFLMKSLDPWFIFSPYWRTVNVSLPC